MSRSKWLTVLAFQLFLATSINGSIGDRSQFYSLCLEKCSENNCNNDQMFKVQPSLSLRLLLWSCREDCSYTCTWKTVDYFTSHGLKVPQFHGKWPFIRVLGCQEPASVIFSLLNFYAHATMYWKFKRKCKSTYPMYYVWSYFSLICMHGWFWSSVFHARDTPFTEVMDYTCAFIMVLTLLYCMLLRITYRNNKSFVVITCGYLSILYSHLSHLWSGYINYDYNMKFNVVIGFSTFVLTMIWWRRNRKRLSYIYLIGWFNVLTVLVTILEVADFAPIFWVFDAHSLWHASTVPLAILIYRFMMADCSYLNTVYSKLTLDIDHHIH
ncbi:post-GPI attachment to proteins factor 3 isoform X1 [Ceratina calcarata]|uniref:Post-GPI attachment to proteins factor 3 n=1 Tax=Ceratina calcarata TaxID=156304 RepID=A0AAJ7J8G8_9HYME|nr:post-GPI attachment to proteins factor 3 isoform X1 [Ceratina calcarata]XP_017886705.1 post-GPI attachment to proteins factor 3 isoform X1 [Ceratina calcarata]